LCALEVQTFKDFEVVVVDAGSIDKTREIVESFHSRLNIVWVYAPNTNMGQARNIGILNSRGEFLAYCDSDDMFEPEKLQAGIDVMLEDPNAEVVFGVCAHFRTESPENLYLTCEPISCEFSMAKQLVRSQSININSLLIRRREEGDIYFPNDDSGRYGEDWQYLINLCVHQARFRFLPGFFSIIEVRSDSHTSWNIQHLMKWYVTRHLALNRDGLIAAGCPPNFFFFHMQKHWIKFLFACIAAGQTDMPTKLPFHEIGGVPSTVVLYNIFVRHLVRSNIMKELIRKIWLINRENKIRSILKFH